MDTRLIIIAVAFAFLLVALVAFIVSLIRSSRRLPEPVTQFIEWPALPAVSGDAQSVDVSLDGLELDIPSDSPSATLLTPIRTGDWRPPDEPAPVAHLAEAALSERIASFGGIPDVREPGSAPAESPDAPTVARGIEPEPEPAIAPQPGPPVGVRVPEVVPSPTRANAPPVVPEVIPQPVVPVQPVVAPIQVAVQPAVSTTNGRTISVPEVVPEESSLPIPEPEPVATTPAPLPIPEPEPVATIPAPLPIPEPQPVLVPPAPKVDEFEARIAALLPPPSARPPLPPPARVVPAVEPAATAPPVPVAPPAVSEPPLVVVVPSSTVPEPVVAEVPTSQPTYEEPLPSEPPSEPTFEPPASVPEPAAVLETLVERVPPVPVEIAAPAPPTAVPEPLAASPVDELLPMDDAYWESMFRQHQDLPSIVAPEPGVETQPAVVAPILVAPPERPTESDHPERQRPTTVVHPPSAVAAAMSPAAEESRPDRTSRPRARVRSALPESRPGRTVAAGATQRRSDGAGAVGPDDALEFAMVAPVEMWFGDSRVGVKAGTKTYEQFRRYADVLLGDLKAPGGRSR